MTEAPESVTETETETERTEAPEAPGVYEFFQNSFKLKSMSLLAMGVGAWFLWVALGATLEGAATAVQAADAAPAPSPLVSGVGGLVFSLVGLILWREGGRTQPILRVTPEGIEDRLFGSMPWEQVRSYRLISSVFSPGFGYSLKSSVRPPRNVPLFMFQMAMNRISGMPSRCFRKQMVHGGCEQVLAAFYAHRPELEGK